MERLIDLCVTEFSSAKDIPDGLVESIFNDNFADFETTSTKLAEFIDVGDVFQRELFRKLRDRLIEFATIYDDNTIWNQLTINGFPAKKLMIIMWYAVERALPKSSSKVMVETGTAAASAYLVLSSIRGAAAYNIFNQFLYERCFGLFRQIQRSYTYGSRDNLQLKPVMSKAKGNGKQKVEEVPDEPNIVEGQLEKSIASELLDEILQDFFILFSKIAFGGYEQSAIITISLIRDICHFDKENKSIKVEIVKTLQTFNALKYKSDKAFALFHLLADDKHSTGGELVHSRVVFPRLALWGLDNGTTSGMIPVTFVQWRDIFVKFLENRIKLKVPSELNVILRVLENLYCRCTDRAEYRKNVTESIIKVLHHLPRTYQYEFIQKVDNFAKNAKNSLRSFSIECVPALLEKIDFTGEDPGPITDQNETMAKKQNTTLFDKPVKKELDSSQTKNADEINNSGSNSENEQVKKQNKLQKKKNKAVEQTARVQPLHSLYHCVIRYCLDKVASIRGRAVMHLSELLGNIAHRERIKKMADEMLENDEWLYMPRKSKRKDEAHADIDDNAKDPEEEESSLDETSFIDVDNLILFIIQKAAKDRASHVRKSGVMALAAFLPNVHDESSFSLLLRILEAKCVDASVLVRKQAAESLSALLKEQTYNNNEIENAWLDFVLPMVNDREQSVTQCASKLIFVHLIQPLIGDTTSLTWSLLSKIEQQDNHKRLLVRTLFYQSQEGVIDDKIVSVLYKKMVSFPQSDKVLWMILANLAVVFKMSPDLALATWYKFLNGESSNKVHYVVKVLVASTTQMQANEKHELLEDLKRKLSSYLIDAPHISVAYLLLAKLLDAVGESASGKRDLEAFGVVTLKNCQKQVKKYIEEFGYELHFDDGESLESMEKRLIRVITTIGEVIQFSPSLIDNCEKLVDALKTIMASDQIQRDSVLRGRVLNSNVPSVNHSFFLSSRPPTAMNSERNVVPSRGPSQSTVGVGSQPCHQGSSTGSQQFSSQPGLGTIIPPHLVVGHLFTPVVRAYCVLALGKFCLMDYKRAKECVPVFVNQLRVNQDHVIRNNIILVICDLCIRNTQLVDRYSPIIAGCLKDMSTLVRHQTLESLTNLIKEQFIRWEGQIMYRFVSTILDDDPEIRKYAEFCLENVLLKQFPDMFYRHFIECLLYFNDISKNHITGESEDTEVDPKMKFTLSGERNRESRMKLYKFMLKTFDDKDKFTIMAHICEKALMPVVIGEFNYKDRKVQALLKDSFDIMSSKEIKLSMDVGKGNEEDEEEPPARVLEVAKKLISDAYRKGIIQTIMPHLLDVRAFLVEKRSPLLKNCLIVLRNICIEHKEQIEEVLGGDKQLQAEIEYDIKKFEEQIQHEQRLAKLAEEERRRSRKSFAKLAEEERRRSRKSFAAAVIMMSAVRNSAKTPVDGNAHIINPIPMDLDDEMRSNSARKKQEARAEPQESKVTEELQECAAQNTDIETGNESDQENVPSESKATDQFVTSKAITTEISTDIKKSDSDSSHTKQSTRSRTKSTDSEKFSTFAAPSGPRKRTREKSIPVDPNDSTALPPRAFSTPNKTMADLTFSNLELSAIQTDDTHTRRRTASRKILNNRKTMNPISEDSTTES